MSERIKAPESQFGKEWLFFGGFHGLKVRDLKNFYDTKPEGVLVLPGASIGGSYFKDFLEANNLSGDINETDIVSAKLPEALFSLNNELLELIPSNKPIAVRSSALNERGGTGIYHTEFLVLTGNKEKDAKQLAKAEKKVYAGYYSDQAKADRQSLDNPSNSYGMGILVQPVIGDKYDNYFMPILSGVFTVFNGEPTFRMVAGLGTKAVRTGEEGIVLQGEEINLRNTFNKLTQLKTADVINLASGNIEQIPITHKLRQEVYQYRIPQKIKTLFESWQNSGYSYYWEFAVDKSNQPAYIVQSAPQEPPKPVLAEFEKPEGKILFEGEDIANTGIKKGKGVIVVGANGFDHHDLRFIKDLNEENKNFLLIVPDLCFSSFLGKPIINLSHFSNAAGLIELQTRRTTNGLSSDIPININHENRGAEHFSGLCQNKNILFLGVNADKSENYLTKLGKADENIGTFSKFWDVEFKMTNIKNKGRVEILSAPKKRKYTQSQLLDRADELYKQGKSLKEYKDDKQATAFFRVIDCLVNEHNGGMISFDPFGFIQHLSQKEIPQLVDNIKIVLDNLYLLESYNDYEDLLRYEAKAKYPLEEYLKEIVKRLEQKAKS